MTVRHLDEWRALRCSCSSSSTPTHPCELESLWIQLLDCHCMWSRELEFPRLSGREQLNLPARRRSTDDRCPWLLEVGGPARPSRLPPTQSLHSSQPRALIGRGSPLSLSQAACVRSRIQRRWNFGRIIFSSNLWRVHRGERSIVAYHIWPSLVAD
ncbi:hypothetical protein P152DRAFT_192065 [Eremomyces bilateralis CBS 781.70]|uniref:Uncharacterized protein n=1 Tax=Eremomyces bilateralis CBS 781.70 TaxID=1392243 RepID=A0A6G1GCK0_9PEZI|nr:uncharacterized protein P152DRAFT_192065 [Eremomyces bilateralis CBS 781.70]KAF1815646.1 hypothetical protein P152DRAFT_192065 [Eremomyces bilateralis CBS 781.70]